MDKNSLFVVLIRKEALFIFRGRISASREGVYAAVLDKKIAQLFPRRAMRQIPLSRRPKTGQKGE